MDRSRRRRFMPASPSPPLLNILLHGFGVGPGLNDLEIVYKMTYHHLLKDSMKKALPKFDKHVKKTLKAQVPDLILKPLNKELNVLNTLENNRIVDLQKKLTKAIKTTIGKYLVNLIRDLLILIDSASTSAKAAPEGEKMST
ncbi:hypothetical protein Tco_0102941 [Tanacetum coccineum]